MNLQLLKDTAKLLFADNKGLLAMDESNGTCNKRFEKLGIPQTVETRRAYRELIVTTPGLSETIGGAILYDETIRQRRATARPLSRSSLRPVSLPASRWTPAPRSWPGIPAKRSPKAWTACAIACRNIFKWARALPSGAP